MVHQEHREEAGDDVADDDGSRAGHKEEAQLQRLVGGGLPRPEQETCSNAQGCELFGDRGSAAKTAAAWTQHTGMSLA